MIKGFVTIAKSLYRAIEEDVKFYWSDKCKKAFETVKQVLTKPPILSYPSTEFTFILDTDASDNGIGAVLSQIQDGVERVIAYYSRVLDKAEINYCVTRRELLTVIHSVKNFHRYLIDKKFNIRADHALLTCLLNFKEPEGQ